jgi:hypothetical protein
MSNKKITDIRTRRKKRYKPLDQIAKEAMAFYRARAPLEEPDAIASGRSIFEQPEEEDEHEDEKPKPHDGL